jgi:hypothetical protein
MSQQSSLTQSAHSVRQVLTAYTKDYAGGHSTKGGRNRPPFVLSPLRPITQQHSTRRRRQNKCPVEHDPSWGHDILRP